MTDLETQQLDLSKINLEILKDYFFDNLTEEQLKELKNDVDEELKLRELKEIRVNKLKKELVRMKLVMKKQLRFEEEEERSKMKKRLQKDEDEEDFDIPVTKLKSKKKN